MDPKNTQNDDQLVTVEETLLLDKDGNLYAQTPWGEWVIVGKRFPKQ